MVVPDPKPPASVLLGREVVSIDADGTARLTYIAKPQFENRHGTVQGGLLAAMLDSATAFALMAQLPEALTAVTTRLDTRFLLPAKTGKFAATARIVAQNDRIARVEAELQDTDGQVVATAVAELRIVRRRA